MQYLVNHKTYNRCKTFLYEFEPRVYFCYNLPPMTKQEAVVTTDAVDVPVKGDRQPDTLARTNLQIALKMTADNRALRRKIDGLLSNRTPEAYVGALQTAQGEIFKSLATSFVALSTDEEKVRVLPWGPTRNLIEAVTGPKDAKSSDDPKTFTADASVIIVKDGIAYVAGFLKNGLNLRSPSISRYGRYLGPSLVAFDHQIKELPNEQRIEAEKYLSYELLQDVKLGTRASLPFVKFVTASNSEKPGWIDNENVVRMPITKNGFFNYVDRKFTRKKR